MGFSSWKTADTNETIANVHSGHPNSERAVYLLQPNGRKPIKESRYNGYCIFGGVHAFAWLAKMNISPEVLNQLDVDEDDFELRMLGIELYCENPNAIKYPLKFSFNENARYEDLAKSESCEFQGFFYNDSEEV